MPGDTRGARYRYWLPSRCPRHLCPLCAALNAGVHPSHGPVPLVPHTPRVIVDCLSPFLSLTCCIPPADNARTGAEQARDQGFIQTNNPSLKLRQVPSQPSLRLPLPPLSPAAALLPWLYTKHCVFTPLSCTIAPLLTPPSPPHPARTVTQNSRL